jgi:hypothetical protein
MNNLQKECELIGAIIGDGYISLAGGKYAIGFTGHPEDDVEYYKYLSSLIENVWDKKITAKVRLRGLRMAFGSKDICLHLINEVGLGHGENKSISAKIPDGIFSDWSLLRFVVRGIADTDGSVFFSKKPGVEKYPAIELTTCSLTLAKQLREALLCRGFRVTKLRSYSSKLSSNLTYKVCLYGKANLAMWVAKIGFSNPYKLARAKALLCDS